MLATRYTSFASGAGVHQTLSLSMLKSPRAFSSNITVEYAQDLICSCLTAILSMNNALRVTLTDA